MRAMKTIASLFLFAAATASAAEFDIDGPSFFLRGVQFCEDCGAGLLVARVPAGVEIRCPECGREQTRLSDRHVKWDVRQLCGECSSPLDQEGLHPGDDVVCGVCHARQTLVPASFDLGRDRDGKGYAPGRLPGTKAMPQAEPIPPPSDPDAAPHAVKTPVPEPEPLPILSPAPYPFAPVKPPETDAQSPETPFVQPAVMDKAPIPPPETPALVQDGSGAVTVPSVTAEMFGGRGERPYRGERAVSGRGAAAAEVNGKRIYESEIARFVEPALDRVRAGLGPVAETAEGGNVLADKEREIRREIVARMIDRELMLQEAERIGYRPDREKARELAAELRPQLAPLGLDPFAEAEAELTVMDMRGNAVRKIAPVSPESVREHYRRNAREFMRPRRLAVKPLVVYLDRAGRRDQRDARLVAEEIAGALEKGGRFDALAEQYNEFTELSGSEGMEPLPEKHFAGEILAALGEGGSGTVVGPLRMAGMFMFCKAVEVRPPEPVPFDEAEKEIRRILEYRAEEASLDEWLSGLRRRSKITVFAEDGAQSGK